MPSNFGAQRTLYLPYGNGLRSVTQLTAHFQGADPFMTQPTANQFWLEVLHYTEWTTHPPADLDTQLRGVPTHWRSWPAGPLPPAALTRCAAEQIQSNDIPVRLRLPRRSHPQAAEQYPALTALLSPAADAAATFRSDLTAHIALATLAAALTRQLSTFKAAAPSEAPARSHLPALDVLSLGPLNRVTLPAPGPGPAALTRSLGRTQVNF